MSIQQVFRRAPGIILFAALMTGGRFNAQPANSAHASAEQPQASILVRGSVTESSGKPVVGAMVEFGTAAVATDASGHWELLLPAGRQPLRVRHEGYLPVQQTLTVSNGMGSVDIVLTPPIRLREDVVVRAVRAMDKDPVCKTDLSATQITAVNRGQEMPFLLSDTPSVNVQSDNGLAAGYAYFNIRGIAQTRLNLTLDGIPLQDPEDQALYFSNFGDFASVVDSVQVQRGVGTSSVGSASYGGSVNFASVNPAESPEAEVRLGGGSWGSGRAALAVNSGRFRNGLALFGRVALQTTDGFRDHSGVDQASVYYGATWEGGASLFKVFGFTGRTRTKLAYLAVEESELQRNLRLNPMSPDEKDSFGQDVVQAQYSRQVGPAATLMAQGYYNGAQGWFRIWDAPKEHLQQYGLNGHLAGLVLGATLRHGRLGLNWGAHINDFRRNHFMDIVGGSRAYLNTGEKNELNTFLKATWTTGRAQLWGDVQVRHAGFRYRGDMPLGSVGWTFFNPKAGIRFDPSASWGLYASAARMSREPARSDMLAGEDNATVMYSLRGVRPESVVDLEAGTEYRVRGLLLKTGLYAMEFRNEIALSGELSDIGLPVRRNAGSSARRGLELEARWDPHPSLTVNGAAMFSRNRIREWKQFFDVFDEEGKWIDSTSRTYRDVAPLLSPPVLVHAQLAWSPAHRLTLDFAGRWVARSQLDNTGSPAYRTPSFFTMDAQAAVELPDTSHRVKSRLLFQVSNLFNARRAWPGGYSYQYLIRSGAGIDTLGGASYFYPLATRSVYVTLDMRF